MPAGVLIVGAGPTGLVLAFWLTRLGVPVHIVDRAVGPGTTSRAVAVQARTLELYQQVGLAEAVVDGGVKVAAANLWVGGAKAARLPLGRMGAGLSPFPFALTFGQDEHERLLVARLQAMGVRVERRTELVRLEQDKGAVRAVLRGPQGVEEAYEASFLAGCDGAHSTVRHLLGIDFAGGTYSGVFYVADVEAEGPAADGDIHVDLDEADFVAVFPLKGAGRLRLVGPASWESAAKPVTFDDVRPRAIRGLKLSIRAVNWFSTYRVHHRVAGQFRVGRAFLLGDAAHVHSPVGGQGMNTGIGDAVNLAWKLAAVVKGEAPERLLGTYERERIGFARRLVATTDRAFTLVTRQRPLARFVRMRAFPLVAPALMRFAAVRRFMFRTISQIGVDYRGSELSEGATGAVHGGMRLPWAGDNYAPLGSLSWQVHVYGDAPAALAETCAELGLPLHRFAWQHAMRGAGLRRDALYLVRPDGYVALADARADSARLRAFWARLFRRPAG